MLHMDLPTEVAITYTTYSTKVVYPKAISVAYPPDAVKWPT